MIIKLIPTKPEFAPTFYQWRMQASTQKHNPLEALDLEQCRSRLLLEGHDLSELWAKKSFRWFVTADEQLVGNVSLKNINKMMLTAEVGYGIGEEFQGQGIGKKAVQLLVKMIFEETPLRKLIAIVHDQNIASCRLLLSIGFKEEGLLREHFIIHGKPANEIIFGLLKSDH